LINYEQDAFSLNPAPTSLAKFSKAPRRMCLRVDGG
jgi:hypothetical protein